MRTRKLGLSLAALTFVSPFAACSGDDDPESGDNGSEGNSAGDDGGIAGPDEPSTRSPDCPFTAKELGKELNVGLKEKNCVFTTKSGPLRISISTDPSEGDETYQQALETAEGWQNFEELDVDGQGFVGWTDDALNITIGYLDNAGAYDYAVSAAQLEDLGVEDPVELADALVELTVEARPKVRSS